MNARFFILLLTLTKVVFSVSSIGFVPVTNFGRSDYDGGTQNWGIARDDAGRMYFGNSQGMLRYDGLVWDRFVMPNASAVRSIHICEDTGYIYVGASNEFGYFYSPRDGEGLHYRSLLLDSEVKRRRVGEVWNIHQRDNTFLFQADNDVFMKSPGRMIRFHFPVKIRSSVLSGENLYTGHEDGSFRMLSPNGRVTRPAGMTLPRGVMPVSMVSLGNDCILIGTSYEGLYIYDGNSCWHWDTPYDSFFRENIIFSLSTNGSRVVVGTVTCGAVVFPAPDSNLQEPPVYINKATGLSNNTVLGSFMDGNNFLALSLDNGLAFADTSSAIMSLLGGSNDIGTGYASKNYDGHIYLATNQGLFRASEASVNSSGPFPQMPEKILDGQVWGLNAIGGSLYVCANAGLFVINGSGCFAVPGVGGCFCVKRLDCNPDHGIVCTYDGLKLISFSSDGIAQCKGIISGYNDTPTTFQEDSDGNIWVDNWHEGIYRLTFSLPQRKFVESRLYDKRSGLPSNSYNAVSRFHNGLIFSTEKGLFHLDEATDSMVGRKENKLLNVQSPMRFFELTPERCLLLGSSVVLSIKGLKSRDIMIDSVTFRRVSKNLVPGFENVNMLNSKSVIVSHQDGFYLLDLDREISGVEFAPFVRAVESINNADSVIYSFSSPFGMRSGKNLSENSFMVGPDGNSLRFQVADPASLKNGYRNLECMLEGFDKDWKPLPKEMIKEYTGLHEGRYVFRVRDTDHKDVILSSVMFRVSPPWFRHPVAYAAYVILLIGAGYVGWKQVEIVSRRKAKALEKARQTEIEETRKRNEQEQLKKDLEIASLKSIQLETDVKAKSQELSGYTMNMVRKNDILLNLSASISKIERNLPDGDSIDRALIINNLDSLQKSIKKNISHDDDWKKFTSNFDIVHADFIARICDKYPGLSKSDLKVCCYLKMGLSSKDIAPLLNIGYRSVEMSRYRLRKKFGLKKGDNLSDFLKTEADLGRSLPPGDDGAVGSD